LVERVADAKARRSADAVTSARFFPDRKERPWKHEEAFRDAFNGLRAKLSDRHPSFQTRTMSAWCWAIRSQSLRPG